MPPRFMRARRPKAAPPVVPALAVAIAKAGHNRPPPDPAPVRALTPTEWQFQVAVVEYLGWALQGIAHFWGTDAGAGKMTRAAAGRRKAQGVRPGTPDIQVLHAGRIHGLELKRLGRGRPSRAQLDEQALWRAFGAPYEFAFKLEEVAALLVAWGIPARISADRLRGEARLK